MRQEQTSGLRGDGEHLGQRPCGVAGFDDDAGFIAVPVPRDPVLSIDLVPRGDLVTRMSAVRVSTLRRCSS